MRVGWVMRGEVKVERVMRLIRMMRERGKRKNSYTCRHVSSQSILALAGGGPEACHPRAYSPAGLLAAGLLRRTHMSLCCAPAPRSIHLFRPP